MQQADLRTCRTPARLAFANHMNRFVTGDGAPRTPERAEMLARVDPMLDRPVILFCERIDMWSTDSTAQAPQRLGRGEKFF